MENVTEINKRSNIREEMLIRNKSSVGANGKSKGGQDVESRYEDIELFTDDKKKKQLMNAFQSNDEIK